MPQEPLNTRQATILQWLQERGRVSVREAAAELGVSEMTIRRDLEALEAQGLLTRTHGGAVPSGRLRFLQSAWPHYLPSPRKAAIGQRAASLVHPGQTIMVDTGTTALEVARHLPPDASITVATTSLCVAQELYGVGPQVLVLGGLLRRDFPSLYGPLTEQMLSALHVEWLFMGCDGADSQEGFYTSDLHLASLEQTMIRCADRVVVVTESSKFGRRALMRYAAPEQVHILVTDGELTTRDRAALEERGLTILIAEE